ncbi:hypothetical protein [Streptomyces achromogenes]|uniref:hypothetical protein n=1 Tax=Streptomyces achromogenes TaxID=67255 RepID=UPI00371EF1F8
MVVPTVALAAIMGSGPPVSGGEAVEKMFRDTLIVHADGTPRTQHVTSDIAIEVEEQAGTAVARCPTCRCSLWPPAGTATASSAVADSGVSPSDASTSASSAR